MFQSIFKGWKFSIQSVSVPDDLVAIGISAGAEMFIVQCFSTVYCCNVSNIVAMFHLYYSFLKM